MSITSAIVEILVKVFLPIALALISKYAQYRRGRGNRRKGSRATSALRRQEDRGPDLSPEKDLTTPPSGTALTQREDP